MWSAHRSRKAAVLGRSVDDPGTRARRRSKLCV
jgi:hypothetical protein